METFKNCPVCGTKHLVSLNHEWGKNEDQRQMLNIIWTGQSAKTDDGRLEWFAPFADDGQELRVTTKRLSDREVLMTITRQPRTGISAPPAAPVASQSKSRADMLTEAGELGLKVNPKWSDLQLGLALSEHKAKVAV